MPRERGELRRSVALPAPPIKKIPRGFCRGGKFARPKAGRFHFHGNSCQSCAGPSSLRSLLRMTGYLCTDMYVQIARTALDVSQIGTTLNPNDLLTANMLPLIRGATIAPGALERREMAF